MYENQIKLALIIFVIIVISIVLIKRFVYFHPSKELLPAQKHYKDITEGNLHGWFLQGTNGKAVLYCHGNAGNVSYRQDHINAINNVGYSVLIFDYSGYGLSSGVPSESQFYQDGCVFMNVLLKSYKKDDIVLYGESMGAAVAAHIARKYQTPILIIDSGLPSIKKYIKGRFGILSVIGFIFPEFNTEKYVNGYRGKILVMHSHTDDVIPYSVTDTLRTLATKTIVLQGTHNNRTIPWEEVNDFILK